MAMKDHTLLCKLLGRNREYSGASLALKGGSGASYKKCKCGYEHVKVSFQTDEELEYLTEFIQDCMDDNKEK